MTVFGWILFSLSLFNFGLSICLFVGKVIAVSSGSNETVSIRIDLFDLILNTGFFIFVCMYLF